MAEVTEAAVRAAARAVEAVGRRGRGDAGGADGGEGGGSEGGGSGEERRAWRRRGRTRRRWRRRRGRRRRGGGGEARARVSVASRPALAESTGGGGLEAPAPACEARTGECVSGLGEACKAHLTRRPDRRESSRRDSRRRVRRPGVPGGFAPPTPRQKPGAALRQDHFMLVQLGHRSHWCAPDPPWLGRSSSLPPRSSVGVASEGCGRAEVKRVRERARVALTFSAVSAPGFRRRQVRLDVYCSASRTTARLRRIRVRLGRAE